MNKVISTLFVLLALTSFCLAQVTFSDLTLATASNVASGDTPTCTFTYVLTVTGVTDQDPAPVLTGASTVNGVTVTPGQPTTTTPTATYNIVVVTPITTAFNAFTLESTNGPFAITGTIPTAVCNAPPVVAQKVEATAATVDESSTGTCDFELTLTITVPNGAVEPSPADFELLNIGENVVATVAVGSAVNTFVFSFTSPQGNYTPTFELSGDAFPATVPALQCLAVAPTGTVQFDSTSATVANGLCAFDLTLTVVPYGPAFDASKLTITGSAALQNATFTVSGSNANEFTTTLNFNAINLYTNLSISYDGVPLSGVAPFDDVLTCSTAATAAFVATDSQFVLNVCSYSLSVTVTPNGLTNLSAAALSIANNTDIVSGSTFTVDATDNTKFTTTLQVNKVKQSVNDVTVLYNEVQLDGVDPIATAINCNLPPVSFTAVTFTDDTLQTATGKCSFAGSLKVTVNSGTAPTADTLDFASTNSNITPGNFNEGVVDPTDADIYTYAFSVDTKPGTYSTADYTIKYSDNVVFNTIGALTCTDTSAPQTTTSSTTTTGTTTDNANSSNSLVASLAFTLLFATFALFF
ncbi:hypothetical protein DLAC_06262 [Tieghemostelium lacteum]|uniref:Uncharacterized protein n=1 Tax=Tieghemostelium lacteum TaxID=361077 RepID=A0A151ZEG3_TIELA|nr:hypothetical protein DLAC_06262 [Tieghemostelium lacteum]|eukprot:KYQ92300.1 hypothetical protein DLAC_06262 [Tieghemostelium lacteum]